MHHKYLHSPRDFLERSRSAKVAELAHVQTPFVAQARGGQCWFGSSVHKLIDAIFKSKITERVHGI